MRVGIERGKYKGSGSTPIWVTRDLFRVDNER